MKRLCLAGCAAWAVVVAGCGHHKQRAKIDAGVPAALPVKAAAPVSDFPASTVSLRLTSAAAIRLEPNDEAKRIGTVEQETRVRWKRTAAGKGCSKHWVEIEPQGWVCAELLEPSTKTAGGNELPRLDHDEVVPGIYGKVTGEGATLFHLDDPATRKKAKTKSSNKKKSKNDDADEPVSSPSDGGKKMLVGEPLVGSMNVRQYAVVTIGGKTYWKINATQNDYVLASMISQHTPSTYVGQRLGDDTGLTLPMALVWPRAAGVTMVWTTSTSKGGGAKRQLKQRTPVPILERATDAAGKDVAYRIGDGEWIDAHMVRVAELAKPPAMLGPHERWIDVDLDQELLVAYEGALPVYITMISAGAKDTPTETGVYRMWKKVSETDMSGLTGEDPYSVATVPWTEFFSPEKGLALHTAYWHDRFGVPRSHGCVNLSPRDARWLYFWSDPQIAPGWMMSAGVLEAPGSVVRVRSAADPDPPLRGYAKRVFEERQASGQYH